METIFSKARNKRRSIGWKLTVIARQLRLNFDQRTKLEGRRSDNRSDRRSYGVHLASGAQPLLDKLDEMARDHETEIFAGISGADLDKLDELLESIARNLSKAEGARATNK